MGRCENPFRQPYLVPLTIYHPFNHDPIGLNRVSLNNKETPFTPIAMHPPPIKAGVLLGTS